VTRYLEISSRIAEQVLARRLRPGAELLSVRAYAAQVGATASTISRAYSHLAEAGVLVLESRRRARVAPDAYLAAMRLQQGERIFRLAGSDDPALQRVLERAGRTVSLTTCGSFGGLRALAAGDADGAAVHLRHHSGSYNAPFAEALLAGRDPHLLRLWRRQQGLIVAPGNPLQINDPADLPEWRVAKREPGAGTRVLLDQLVTGAGAQPDAVRGPEFTSHVEIALAVAAGIADVGLALSVAAVRLGLDFVPLVWEHFDVVLPGDALGAAEPLIAATRDRNVRAAMSELPGYDLAEIGHLIRLPVSAHE
jgi:molybdate-binding protein